MSITTISLMGKLSCKRDNFLALQNYKVWMMFISVPVMSAQEIQKRRVMECSLGSFPAHTKESYQV